jgi:hypothetical protein
MSCKVEDKMIAKPCKICMREYETRPNDLCNNYLHWQAYVYQLEGKKASKLPKFASGDHVQIVEELKSAHDYGVWFGKSGVIKTTGIRERHRPRSYCVKMGGLNELKVYECDLEKIG